MEINTDNLQLILVVIVLIVQVVAQWVWVKHELRQLRKDSEAMDKAIEDKRHANVAKLREIYDLKISDNRAYAKGLFEQQVSEFRSINTRMQGVENQLQKILDILMNK